MSKPHKPSIRLTSITLGAPALRELAQFYANLLEQRSPHPIRLVQANLRMRVGLK